MKNTRTPFTPKIGQIYRNKGGGSYECMQIDDYYGEHVMRNVASGWTFTAHGIAIYDDGMIDWDFSTNGRFEK